MDINDVMLRAATLLNAKSEECKGLQRAEFKTLAAELLSARIIVIEHVAICRRAERKLSAYVGVCGGDKELTKSILPSLRLSVACISGGANG